MNTSTAQAIIAAILLAADRIAEQQYRADADPDDSHWPQSSHEEAIEEARLLLRAAAEGPSPFIFATEVVEAKP